MHLLYLDDSGSAGNIHEDYFVLGGLSVPETSVRWLSHQLERIANEIDPVNPNSVEFHAAEIFSGSRYPWNRLVTRDQRTQLIQRVLQVLRPAHADLVAFACAVHKPSYPGQDPVIIAYEDISSRFNYYLQRIGAGPNNQQRGLIILDRSSYETGLQNLASTIRREGNRWGDYNRSIVEIPMFIDSKAARIIQLADHIAYAVFRRYNANDLTYYNHIENRFDQRDGVICGLAHKQNVNRSCTCPACITRRDRPQPTSSASITE